MDLSEARACLRLLETVAGPGAPAPEWEALRVVLKALDDVSARTEEWDACDEHGNPLMEGFGEAAGELRGLGF